MNWARAIDEYLGEMRRQGRISSAASERAYYDLLKLHADDAGRIHTPLSTNRDHVRATLARWENPNTVANRRSMLVSFYDWLVEDGQRTTNPARQTKRPRKRKTQVYRLTREEARAMLLSCSTWRERIVIWVGMCAGLRNQELRGLQGRHFERPGFVWVSADIGKGGRERWVPAIPDLADVIAYVLEHYEADDFVVPHLTHYNFDPTRQPTVDRKRPVSGQTIGRIVGAVAKRAGIAAHIHPHLLRHAYGDHIARYTGMRNAQFLLGHADVSTTETYVGAPTLDELTSAVDGFTFLESQTNERSGVRPDDPESQEYRHGDSNPGSVGGV